jgi:aryl-alcohol dehydrogenase-like predicted oxidoreductase
MIDTAEVYSNGKSEEEMYACSKSPDRVEFSLKMLCIPYSGRVIKELGLRRTDLIITTKIFWGVRSNREGSPNDTGLSRKQ